VSDSEYAYEGLTLCVKYESDALTQAEQTRSNPREEGAGFLVIGVELEGVFVPIERRKAAGIRADIERAKQSRQRKPERTEAQRPAESWSRPEQHPPPPAPPQE
jgi:hypothetical protein